MTIRTGTGRVRSGGQARRTKPVRRRSAGLSPTRAGAFLAMLGSAVAIYGAWASGAFAYRHLQIEGDHFTSTGLVESTLGLAGGENLFLLSTDPLRARLTGLPTIASVDVSIGLPDSVTVRLTEREPILAWVVGGQRFLIDRDAKAFAAFPADATDLPDAVRNLPVVVDERAASAGFAVGATLDPIDYDVATRLGALKPEAVASSASRLTITVNDDVGFVLGTDPETWTAIFGFYTPTIRKPEMIPGQVRLLASLLAGRENRVALIRLSSETDGTYESRTSGSPRPSASPSSRPSNRPSPTPSRSPSPGSSAAPHATDAPPQKPSPSPKPSPSG